MSIRLKTIRHAFPVLASLPNNTLTDVTQTTIYLPETGTKTFKSVVAMITMADIITGTGGTISTKTVAMRLDASAYTTISNANALTNSGENLSLMWRQDFNSLFAASWSGTSMTCDFRLQFNQSTGVTTGMVNVCVTLDITYEYDDTSTTHIKSVMIPLNMPTAAMRTVAATDDTIPALDTYLPEASKVYRNIHIVLQGNEGRIGVTTDHTMTLRVGSASETTGNYEGALATDRFIRYVWDLTSVYPDTSTTQAWQPTCTIARCQHMQAYMVVTYEFNETTSTSIMNSVMMPMEIASPMGGTTATDYQRGNREIWVQEPLPIVTERVAFFPFFSSAAPIAGLNMRIGTDSFILYTDTLANNVAGTNAAMIRNDAALTLSRGRNAMNFDAYRTDTADLGWNVSGFWIVNYTSGKASSGSASHNHTVLDSVKQFGTIAAATRIDSITATSLTIPENNYFVTALGTQIALQSSSTGNMTGIAAHVERLAAEGGIQWEICYQDQIVTDPEVGMFFAYAQMRGLFFRWAGDPDSDRMNLETNRRWRIYTFAASTFQSIDYLITYHSITYDVADTITGFSGTVDLSLHRASGEKVATTTRSGDGTFSFAWYDNTEPMYVIASDGTKVGRSSLAWAS